MHIQYLQKFNVKNLLIIGGTRGIGLEIARQNENKFNLFLAARNQSTAIPSSANFYELDVASGDINDFPALPEQIHGLVYCPGTINLKPFQNLKTADYQRDFEINLLGAVRIIQALLPRIKVANSSSIVLFSSVAASIGMPFHCSVTVAKRAIEGLTISLAAELASSNVRVNAIAPSLTNTELASAFTNTPEKLAQIQKRHPIQRIGKPSEVASLASFLLSDEASWITGQILSVDGGLSKLKL
jgi:3-oxoacyl-[acyl-carrier protein] reductase